MIDKYRVILMIIMAILVLIALETCRYIKGSPL
jgi:hypothetical protein